MTTPTVQQPQILLTGRDAARALAVSEQTLRRAVRRGEIRAVKFAGGRTVRFAVDELQRFASGQERVDAVAIASPRF